MGKEESCGDDFSYRNAKWARTYTTPSGRSVAADYFQPQPGVWYTIWQHVKMNSAGACCL